MNTDIDLSSLDNFDLSPEWESEQKKVRSTPKDKNLKSKKDQTGENRKVNLKTLKVQNLFCLLLSLQTWKSFKLLKKKLN